MSARKLKVALVGLGKQTVENHLPALMEARNACLTSVCDPDSARLEEISSLHNIRGFLSIDELIARARPEFAIIAVPHNAYLPIIERLAAAGVHILKEKPFATSMAEATRLHQLIQDTSILAMVTLVRRFHPIFSSIGQLLKRIGSVHTISGRYTMNIDRLDVGWRSNRAIAGGGAVLDMGYHTIDLLVWYFGLPSRIAAKISFLGRENQSYDVEDTATILFSYDSCDTRAPIIGTLLISRAFPEKDERLLLVGSRGTIVLRRTDITRLDASGNEIESLARKGSWLSANVDQIESFADAIDDKRRVGRPLYFPHFEHMAFVEAVYLSASTDNYINPKSLLPEFARESI